MLERDNAVSIFLFGNCFTNKMLPTLQIQYILDKSFENIIHDIVASVHRTEKLARTQSAVIEARQKAEKYAKQNGIDLVDGNKTGMPTIETDGAMIKDGKAYLKGNPLKTIKNIICPNCKLPRLMYPRVGYGARDPPDPRQQYCKNEPPIIIDKHDVHGQRKKGTKLKGPAKAKQKKGEAQSPGSSPSAPSTPLAGSFQAAEAFDFKTIEYPAAKCPNRDSTLGDHWKPVTQMATHLNGNCYLKRDRAAGREAVAKMSGTPADSRATSPKPTTNGKRGRALDDIEGNGSKKKQKLDVPKKVKKGMISPSKLKDVETPEKDQTNMMSGASPKAVELVDSIKIAAVKPKKPSGFKREQSEDRSPSPELGEENKPHLNGGGGRDRGFGKPKPPKLHGKISSKAAASVDSR